MSIPELEQQGPTVETLTDITPGVVADYQRLLPQLSSKELPEPDIIQARLLAATDPTNPDVRTVVIRDGEGHIQASATASICRIPTGEKPWIDDVVTDQNHRGRGFGGLLMADLHAWLEGRGVTSVNLTSKPDREAAGNLYERDGYVQRDTRVYRKPLGGAALSTNVAQQ